MSLIKAAKKCPNGPFSARLSLMKSRRHMLCGSFAFSSLQVYFLVQKDIFFAKFFSKCEIFFDL